ncbi:MAG: 30S ribosomal protein S20 [Rickettsiales bacterium]|jgi:small subunit ribosomal protein S20|nr:30S ribosomal protein S20 [Rickettsiales bacterium]
MANHKSAKKRITRNEAKRVQNKSALSYIRTLIKKFEKALTSGNKEEAATAFKTAEKKLAQGASKNLLKKNTASRKTSRMNAKLKNM